MIVKNKFIERNNKENKQKTPSYVISSIQQKAIKLVANFLQCGLGKEHSPHKGMLDLAGFLTVTFLWPVADPLSYLNYNFRIQEMWTAATAE